MSTSFLPLNISSSFLVLQNASTLLTGLSSWWGLHDASGVDRIDSSGNNNPMVLNGTVTSIAGLIGNAASFDGNTANFLRASPFLSTPFSMSVWLNAVNLSTIQRPFGQPSGIFLRQAAGNSAG